MGSRSEALRAELVIKRLPKGTKLAALLSLDLLGKGDTDSTLSTTLGGTTA